MHIKILEDGYKVKYFHSDIPHLLIIFPLFNSLHNYGLIFLKKRSRELGEVNENIEDDLAVKEFKEDISMDHKICTHKLFPHTTTN